MKKFLLAMVLCAFAALPALALDLGDPSPGISAETWVTGEPADPTKVDGNTFFLVEVWSVSCPPCLKSIPILNDLQKRYADQGLRIVSFTSDTVEEVKEFLESHPMEYSSFIDKEGASTISFMAADNRTTIPHAFLFDRKGALVWIGNPLDNLESRIKGVLSGELNRERAIAIRDAKEDLQNAFGEQNIPEMLANLKKLEQLEPENPQYYQVHYRILAELGVGEPKEVQELLNAWYKGSADQPEGLVILSMLAMDTGTPAMRNPRLALAAAQKAYALDSDLKVQAGLNLADIYKAIGRIDLAVKTVQDLLPLTDDPEEKQMITDIHDFYVQVQELGKNPDAPLAQ